MKKTIHPAVIKAHPFAFLLAVLLISVGGLVYFNPALESQPLLVRSALAGAVMGIGSLIYLKIFILSKLTELTVTDGQVHYAEGIINRSTSDIEISKIRVIKVQRSLLDMLFGVGTLEIYTTGDDPEIRIVGIEQPHAVRTEIMEQMEHTEDEYDTTG